MNKDLIRYLLEIAFFFVLVFIVDRIGGVILDYASSRCPGDKDYYEFKKADEEILIFGSSRAYHNYNPIVFADSLHVPVRNCGYEGMGIVNMYAKYKTIIERNRPKLIIYDFFYVFDFYREGTGDLSKYISPLRRFSKNSSVNDVIVDIDSKDKLKMLSRLYCYNSKGISILTNFLTQNSGDNIDGYSPVNQTMNPDDAKKNAEIYDQVDSVKLRYLETFVNDVKSKGIPIVFCLSPYYCKVDYSEYYNEIRLLCSKWDVPLLDYTHNPSLINDYKYYYDASHLNAVGALEYSKLVVSDLKRHFNLF